MQVCFEPQSSCEPTSSWYDLPVEFNHLLLAAADIWEDTAPSQNYRQQAWAIADTSLEVRVAAYRYFFYKNNDAATLQVATQGLEQIRPLQAIAEATVITTRVSEMGDKPGFGAATILHDLTHPNDEEEE